MVGLGELEVELRLEAAPAQRILESAEKLEEKLALRQRPKKRKSAAQKHSLITLVIPC